MNLITDQWLPVIRKDGSKEKIAPWQITDGINDGRLIIEIDAPRADFKGALYQFLIGLLQTAFAPEDEDEWLDYWENAPDEKTLRNAFSKVQEAFDIDSEGPAFMQDFYLPEGEEKSISTLLIEAPGSETKRDNRDHFIKRDRIEKMSPYWAAIALFTLQINAPTGGRGNRVSLRGGGPLTSLVLPDEADERASLWKTTWLNVLTQEEAVYLKCNSSLKNKSAIFPWMAPTHTSEKRTGADTLPEHCHPYQMYWAMPRRIRLIFSQTKACLCDLTGERWENPVCSFRTKNYGINYSGAWQHPLTPYTNDPQRGPLSIKAQPGGISYRHWLGLGLDDNLNHRQVACIVQIYLDSRINIIRGDYQPRLWCFGYDMDKMKARCWYEATMPIFSIPEEGRDDIQEHVIKMINAASEVLFNLRTSIKQAWFSRPKDAKGDLSFINSDFWNKTEDDFYRLLGRLIKMCRNNEETKGDVVEWQRVLQKQAEALFDQWALCGDCEDGDMKRVVKARQNLIHWLWNGKQMRSLSA